ncbi:MAG: hypothetical protein U1F43_03640 [Myxococcota bacterium]
MTVWLLALMCRESLLSHALRVARRYRDLISEAEVMSALDLGLSLAAAKFDPSRGGFQDLARPIVERVVKRTAKRELAWRSRSLEGLPTQPVLVDQQAELESWRNELKELLGPDYDTFMSHFGWGMSMRDLGRREERSFRSVRDSLQSSIQRVAERYDFDVGPMQRAEPGGLRVLRRSGGRTNRSRCRADRSSTVEEKKP